MTKSSDDDMESDVRIAEKIGPRKRIGLLDTGAARTSAIGRLILRCPAQRYYWTKSGALESWDRYVQLPSDSDGDVDADDSTERHNFYRRREGQRRAEEEDTEWRRWEVDADQSSEINRFDLQETDL